MTSYDPRSDHDATVKCFLVFDVDRRRKKEETKKGFFDAQQTITEKRSLTISSIGLGKGSTYKKSLEPEFSCGLFVPKEKSENSGVY